ncbi:hypothetical protein [Paenibacillus dendritiformis]|uniref:hypothetical protein n=1 Tax=Paenibacillus dendritiformis TaxID=130049 RepID=UPI00387E05B6
MEIINTINGSPVVETSTMTVIILVLCIGLGVALFLTAIDEASPIMAIFGLVICIVATSCLAGGYANRETDDLTPTKYEVILREGHVIDATKYEIIEQRGKIFVIQEREGN